MHAKFINEFKREGDALSNMGIGKKHLIEEWISKKLRKNYATLNDDMTIDYKDRIYYMDIYDAPEYIKFNVVDSVNIVGHDIKNLHWFPNVILDDLVFYNNTIKLTEDQVNSMCKVYGNIQLEPIEKFTRKLYRKRGPIASRKSPIVKQKISRNYTQYSKGYKLYKLLGYINVVGKVGRSYTEIIKFLYEMSYGKGRFNNNERGYASGYFKYGGIIRKLTTKNGKNYAINEEGLERLYEYEKLFKEGVVK